jgi:tetratricopeptide (TPR) repeat protein
MFTTKTFAFSSWLWQKEFYKKIVILVGIVALMFTIYLVQKQISAEERITLSESLLHFPSGEHIRLAAMGFDPVIADLLWARAVVSFGEQFHTDKNYKWLYHPLDIITTLDPYFEEVYMYGGILLAMEAKRIDESIALLEKGIKSCPESWRLYFYLGFYYTYYKNDNEKASIYIKKAASLPGHPDYLPRLVGLLYAKLGKIEFAIEYLKEIYKLFEDDEKMRAAIDSQIKELVVEKHTIFLKDAAEIYKKVRGKYPSRLEDLIAAGVINAIPVEPNGGQYVIEPETGEIKTTTVEQG